MDDLPTDWSPKKIILYLVLHPTALDEILIYDYDYNYK